MGGYHRWVVEFVHRPDSVVRFAEVLDAKLRSLNSDYDAKRRSVMQGLQVVVVPRGTFHRWQMMEGRRKVTRLKNDSSISDTLLRMGGVAGSETEINEE